MSATYENKSKTCQPNNEKKFFFGNKKENNKLELLNF